WRSGQFQSARLDWTAACELIHAQTQPGLNFGSIAATMFPGTPQDLQGSWHNWVMADLLRRECDEVIAQSDQSLEATSKSNTFSQENLMILSRELGEWHAIRGEWEQARNRFEYVHRFSPSPAVAVRVDYLRALASLNLGDEQGFLSLREEAISRFKGTTDAADAEYVLQAGLLRPVDNTSATALEPYAQVLERAVASAGQLKEGTATPAAFHLTLLGLFAYRRGDYAEALEDCQRSLTACTHLAAPSAMDRVIRAMSFHTLGDDAAARSELDTTRSLVQGGLNIGFD